MKKTIRVLITAVCSMILLVSVGLTIPKVYAAEESSEPAETTYTITVIGGSPSTLTAEKGDEVTVYIDHSVIPDGQVFDKWVGDNGVGFSDPNVDKATFIMPAANVTITAQYKINPEIESRSIEESIKASESESVSIEESIKASEKAASESESVEESIRQSSIEESSRQEAESRSIEESREAASHLIYDGYDITTVLNGVSNPEGFIRANDLNSFERSVEAFYSSKYRVYVYYATKNDESGYYLLNSLSGKLYPFVTFTGEDGKGYIVSTPRSINDLPQEVSGEKSVDLTRIGSPNVQVPGWIAEDSAGKDVTLLHLAGEDGKREFFVYDDSGAGIQLIPWSEYEPEEKSEEEETTEEETSSEEETTEESTEETSTEEETKKKSGLDSKFLIWLIIIGAIILLLIIAIVVVFFMSRKQEREENDLDDEDPEDFRTKPYDSNYTPGMPGTEDEDTDPFDISFEDAFPEEMHVQAAVKTPEPPAAEEIPEETLDAEAAPEPEYMDAESFMRPETFEKPEENVIADLEAEIEPEIIPEPEETFMDPDEFEKQLDFELDPDEEDPEIDPFDSELDDVFFRGGDMKKRPEPETGFRQPEIVFGGADPAVKEVQKPETQTAPKPKKNSFRDVLSEDDFEVVDFSQKKK